ncbi:Dynamin, GTPase domain protein [Niveomyces insectorum RCEF 264]|uniref:Dynamin, GTPase domain protein n=1 Tax=Niveomyces insectorum RCEF 264 TaxID=1081102 RepID=A0A167RC09_9HYPO|nr:Dynamin, GTPase domain protein [Niveomyces insectorum RCEF 264]
MSEEPQVRDAEDAAGHVHGQEENAPTFPEDDLTALLSLKASMEPSPPPTESQGYITSETEKPSSSASTPPSPAPSPVSDDGIFVPKFEPSPDTPYPWADGESYPPERRVEILEEAVDVAMRSGQQIVQILRKAETIEGQPKFHDWIKEYEDILKTQKAFSFRVGVSGYTGAGKTTILNALLDYNDLLPSGSEGAATGVVCVVHGNTDTRPTKRFRADVRFRQRREVEEWLELQFQDLRALGARRANKHGDDSDDNGSDSDYREESDNDAADRRGDLGDTDLSEQFAPIRAVWGYEEEALRTMTPADLLASDADIAKLLSTTFTICDGDADTFSDKIKPYLDCTPHPTMTTEACGHEVCLWPLIEHVDLYVPAAVLANGVSLEDLPGLGDAVEMRAKVAHERFNALDATIIVSAAIRAADESVAAKLISDNQAVRLQLDNKLNRHTFCVVVSKTDDLEWEPYLRKSMRAPDGAKVRDHYETFLELRRDAKQLATHRKAALKLQSETAAKCEQLEANNDFRRLGPAKQHLAQLKHQLAEMAREQEDLVAKQAYYSGLLCFECTQARNEKVRRKLQENFLRKKRRLIQSKNGAPLPPDRDGSSNNSNSNNGAAADREDEDSIEVLPVSARAYMRLKQPDASCVNGFPEKNYTGIPALRAWVRRATVPARTQHATALLHRLHVLLGRLKAWFDHEHLEIQSFADPSLVLRQILDPFEETLVENLKICSTDLVRSVERCNPLEDAMTTLSVPARGRAKRFNPKCRKDVLELVERWRLRDPRALDKDKSPAMHVSTHAAIVRRKGGRATIVYTEVTALWTKAFHQTLPQAALVAGNSILEAWDVSLKKISGILPMYFPNQRAYLGQQLAAFRGIRDYVINQVEKAMFEVALKARAVHPTVGVVLERGWRNAFRFWGGGGESDCMALLGILSKGSMMRRQEQLLRFAGNKTTPLIRKAIEGMGKQIQANVTAFQLAVAAIWDDGLAKIKAQIEAMTTDLVGVGHAEQARAASGQDAADSVNNHRADEQASRHTAQQLQSAVNEVILRWHSDWAVPSSFSRLRGSSNGSGKTDDCGGREEGTAVPADYLSEPDEALVEAPSDAEDAAYQPRKKGTRTARVSNKRKNGGSGGGGVDDNPLGEDACSKAPRKKKAKKAAKKAGPTA